MTAWLSKGDTNDNLRGYAIYRSDTIDFNIDSARVFQFIPYDQVAGFVRSATVPPASKTSFYFATAISRNNVESQPVPIIFSTFGN